MLVEFRLPILLATLVLNWGYTRKPGVVKTEMLAGPMPQAGQLKSSSVTAERETLMPKSNPICTLPSLPNCLKVNSLWAQVELARSSGGDWRSTRLLFAPLIISKHTPEASRPLLVLRGSLLMQPPWGSDPLIDWSAWGKVCLCGSTGTSTPGVKKKDGDDLVDSTYTYGKKWIA